MLTSTVLGITPKQQRLLVFLASGDPIRAACRKLQIPPKTFYYWLKNNADFRGAYGMEMSDPNSRVTPKQKEMIALLVDGSLLVTACQKVAIHPNTFRNWLQTDPDFQKVFEEMLMEKLSTLAVRLVGLGSTALFAIANTIGPEEGSENGGGEISLNRLANLRRLAEVDQAITALEESLSLRSTR